MDYSIEELKELFPRWEFKKIYLQPDAVDINNGLCWCYAEKTFIRENIDLMKHIYDTQKYVVEFLKENGFIEKIFDTPGYVEFEKNDITVIIAMYYYLSINDVFNLKESNYDRFMNKLKEILDIESHNKSIFDLE